MSASTPTRSERYIDFRPRGGVREAWLAKDDEILVSGPAGTGKTRGLLELLHLRALKYAGSRGLICRQTRVSLTQTALVTFDKEVNPHADGASFHGGRQEYTYPNGSVIVVGGLDREAQRIFSGQYDHIYCFVGETRVQSPSPIQKAYRRQYSGPLVTIRTALGHELTGTPNHPILTDEGWIALGKIREGDHVVSRRLAENMPVAYPDVDHDPAAIAEVYRSLSESPGTLGCAERVPLRSVDFHGDGANGYVDVVTTSALFCLNHDATSRKPGGHLLVGRTGLNLPLLEGRCASRKVVLGTAVPSDRLVATFPPGEVGFRETGGPVACALAERERLLAASAKRGLEGFGTDPKGGADGQHGGFPFEVALDRVVHRGVVNDDSGVVRHVYNLQTGEGYYLANNIIVHNCNEATELDEATWENLTTRLRNGKSARQQISGDCNPDRPTHWLYVRSGGPGGRGKTIRFESHHEDNPRLHNGTDWTEAGLDYLAKLDALTGPRRLRLRHGRWVRAEGVIYEGWDPSIHLVNSFDIPHNWPRVWSIDFGFTNAFCCLMAALDGDGRLYVYRQVYHTKRLVTDHAERLRHLSLRDPRPHGIVADSEDREGRETLAKEGFGTVAAIKHGGALQLGIQAVQARLRLAGDGKPRLYVMRDSLDERDPDLVDARRPTCLEEEMDGYCWHDKGRDEPAANQDDHACDCLRYLVFALDAPREPEEDEGTTVITT